MDSQLVDLLNEGVRVLFLLVIPVAGAGLLAALVAAALQVVTSLQDPVFSYCFRLFACVVVVGLLCVSFAASLQELMIGALR